MTLNSDSQFSDPEFLKTLLKPLLEDFQFWFGRSRSLLETQQIEFLGMERQNVLLERVKQAQQEVGTAQALIAATDGQVGLDTAILMPWHHLVTECWQVAVRFRMERQDLGG